jgi:hypothetical protein
MADASVESGVAPGGEDMPPELATRLQHLDHERARCLEYAAKLSGWAMFWKILLVVLGALIAAQGALVKVWGQANWITIAFILLGVLTALAGGFDVVFRPAERSPKFAQMGFEYEHLHREVFSEASSLMRHVMRGGSERGDNVVQDEIDQIVNQADTKLDSLREKELALYVTGPARMGYRGSGREKLWRRWSG